MNYMWQILLEGEEQGLDKDDIRFQPSRIANPYREVFFKDFNKPVITEEPIDVNAYYRYGTVFGPLLKSIFLSAETEVNIVGTSGVDIMCGETTGVMIENNVQVIGQEVKAN